MTVAAAERRSFNRVYAVARMGITSALRNNWIRRGLILTIMSSAGWAFVLLVIVRFPDAVRRLLKDFVGNVLYFRFINDPGWILPELVALLTALAGSDLISSDIRNRSFPIYFTRGMKVWQYVSGKFIAISFYLFLCLYVPAFFVFSSGVSTGLEGDLPTSAYMADFGGVCLNLFIYTLPIASIILMFSSLSKSPYAGSILFFIVYFTMDKASDALRSLTREKLFAIMSVPELVKSAATLCYEDRVGWKKTFTVNVDPVSALLILGAITVAALSVTTLRVRFFKSQL